MHNFTKKTLFIAISIIHINGYMQLNASSFLCGLGNKTSAISQSGPDDRQALQLHHQETEICQWLSEPNLFESTNPSFADKTKTLTTVSIAYFHNKKCEAKINGQPIMALPDVVSAQWENSGAITMILENGSGVTFTPKDKLCPHPKKILSRPLKKENAQALVVIHQDYNYIKRTVWNKIDETLIIEYLDSEIDLQNTVIQNQLLQEPIDSIQNR